MVGEAHLLVLTNLEPELLACSGNRCRAARRVVHHCMRRVGGTGRCEKLRDEEHREPTAGLRAGLISGHLASVAFRGIGVRTEKGGRRVCPAYSCLAWPV